MASQNVEISEQTIVLPRQRGTPWEPGQSGNPNGRPRPHAKTITDALRALIAEHGGEPIANVLWQDALTAKKALDRRMAAQEIMDRVEGRPVQSMRLEQSLDAGSVRAIADMAAMFAPSVIDLPGANRPLIAPSEETKADK